LVSSCNARGNYQKEPLEKYQGAKAISYDATPPTSQSSEADSETGLYNTPKTTLDDFELLKVIGKGSYGKVTLVRKKEGKRLFAMKSLNKSNVKRRNQVEHTRTERRVLGRAKHPFIVHLHVAEALLRAGLLPRRRALLPPLAHGEVRGEHGSILLR
jgi:serine/threonine protein kinase